MKKKIKAIFTDLNREVSIELDDSHSPTVMYLKPGAS
jgi:hypothetical protein